MLKNTGNSWANLKLITMIPYALMYAILERKICGVSFQNYKISINYNLLLLSLKILAIPLTLNIVAENWIMIS